MAVSYESNISNPDGNIHVDLSRLRDILDFSILPNPDDSEHSFENESASGGLAGSDMVLDNRQKRTELLRLPPITQPDHSSAGAESASNATGSGADTGRFNTNPFSRMQEMEAAHASPAPQDPDMALPADLFFGYLPQETNGMDWWNNVGSGHHPTNDNHS